MFLFPITKKSRVRYGTARQIYAQCVTQARRLEFYAALGVPDTFDGRFEMTSLHVGLVVSRLSGLGHDGEKLAQALFDEMFLSMELTCREMGVGDLSVPRHIKRMMKAFKGRTLTYLEAMKQGAVPLADALARNLYGTVERPAPAILAAMDRYVLSAHKALSEQTYASLSAGTVTFPQPDLSGVEHGAQSQAA